jgi:vesicular inhibitory amino acid transporter
VSFGPRARIATSILFCVELIAACVALVILFADSLNALVPGYSLEAWKLICGVLLIPLSFLPLRYLGFTSILGILCCLLIFFSIFIGGLLKPDAPGSLLSPMITYAFPLRWQTIPLSFGLLMSPWGAHSVFPQLYRDMRHPYKWRKSVNLTYAFSASLDFATMVIGLLMFGDGVLDGKSSSATSKTVLITLHRDYFKHSSSRRWVPACHTTYHHRLHCHHSTDQGMITCIFNVSRLKIHSKVPLNAAPIVSTLELVCGISSRTGATGPFVNIAQGAIRILVVFIFVGLAIVFPAFDRIMALLGSVACFSICIILPVGFHLALFGPELGKREKIINWSLLISSVIMAVISTVFACLPRNVLNGDR